jgi:photosystem II stability/assembly factor-like uncharacterized protein
LYFPVRFWFYLPGTVFLMLVLWLLPAEREVYAQDKTSGPWVMQSSGTKANLRGIHTVGGGIVWASGSNGTVLRTEDSGYMWQSCAMPPGAEKLDFRGIWAWDENTAVVMSSGPGEQSRLYRTTDGCSHWTLLYTNPDKEGFWDAMAFWDREHEPRRGTGKPGSAKPETDEGMIFGDPVDGHFIPYEMSRGGTFTVRSISVNALPALPGEGAFAASNSSVCLGERSREGESTTVWFGTGGKSGPRVFEHRFDQRGNVQRSRWEVVTVPLAGGTDSSGVFAIAFPDGTRGMAVGGDYKKPNESSGTAAWSADRGEHWTAAEKPPHGFRSAVAWDWESKAWITVGTNGSDVSRDGGQTWHPLDDGNWNALSLPWVVGPQGRIARLDGDKLGEGGPSAQRQGR